MGFSRQDHVKGRDLPPPGADPRSAAELRQLIALLERSGLAERRSDARVLLESSRALLRAHHGGRAAPSRRKLAGKLLALGLLLVDAIMVAGFCAGLGGWLAGILVGPLALILLLAAPAWALLRLVPLRVALVEASLVIRYHVQWGWDWFAEAFSSAAMLRLEARLAAREVMWAWQRHRRNLLHRAQPGDVEEFLGLVYGGTARDAFSAALEVQRQQGRAERLNALRWLALIHAFEGLAAAGALHLPAPEQAPPQPAAPPIHHMPPLDEDTGDNPERIQRRRDLRELIRCKRGEVTTAYNWKLKTPSEIAQRELHVDELKADLAALERELVSIDA